MQTLIFVNGSLFNFQIASERKRQKTEDYLFLYFPSYVNNGKLHASLSVLILGFFIIFL